MFTLTYPLDSNSKPQTALNTTYNQDTDLLIVRVCLPYPIAGQFSIDA